MHSFSYAADDRNVVLIKWFSIDLLDCRCFQCIHNFHKIIANACSQSSNKMKKNYAYVFIVYSSCLQLLRITDSHFYRNWFFFLLLALFVSLASLLSSNLNSIITLHYTCITLLFVQRDDAGCHRLGVLSAFVRPFTKSQQADEQAHVVIVVLVVVVCFQVFLSLWIVFSSPLTLTPAVVFDARVGHADYLMFVYI